MANEVVTKDLSVWIQNEKGKRVSKIYYAINNSCINITKNFLEIIVDGYFLGYKLDFHEKLIININNSEVLYKQRFEHNDEKKFNKLASDYVYLDAKTNDLLDNRNCLVKHDVISIKEFPNNMIIAKSNSGKYSIIRCTSCLLYEIEFCKVLNPNRFFLMEHGEAKIYDSKLAQYIVEIQLSEQNPIYPEIFIVGNNEYFLFTEYEIVTNSIIKKTSQIRSLNDLSKVVLSFEDNSSEINKCDELQKYRCITIYKENFGYKIFVLEKNRYLSEEYAQNISVLSGNRNTEYLLLEYKNRIEVYSLPDFNLLLSGDYACVSLSSEATHFVLVKEEYVPIPKIVEEVE